MNIDLSNYVDPAKDEKFLKEYHAARKGIGHNSREIRLSCDHYPEPDPDEKIYIFDESNPPWKLPPKASQDDEADKKRKRKTSKAKKKIQARKDNPSSPTTTRSESIETLAEKNLDPVIDPSASTASGSGGTRTGPALHAMEG